MVCGLLLAAGLATYCSRPIYRQWKHRRFLAQAGGFMAKGDDRNAALSARQALNLKPQDIEAIRILARITEKYHSPLALDWWQRVVNLEPGVPQNRLDLARSALLLGNYTRADQALLSMDKINRNTVAYHQLAAMVAVAENNLAAADWHFAKAANLNPQNKRLQFNQAVIHLQAKNKTVVAAAQETLKQLYADPIYRKDALRHLAVAAVRNKDFAQAEAFSKELQADPKASFEDRILHLSVLRQADSPDWKTYLESLKAEAAKNPDHIYTLASWLVAHESAAEVWSWLSALPETLRSQPPVRMALADVCLERRDWAGLEKMLADQNWRELDSIRLAQLARAASEQKQTIAAQSNWQAAIRATAGRLPALFALARLANAWHWEREREELLWMIVQRYPSERWALQLLNDFYLAGGNTRGLQKVYATLVDFDPADMGAKNNLASIDLLLDTQLPRAHRLAREAYEKYPHNPAFASTYAFSLHRQGRTGEGLKVLETLPLQQLENSAIAVYYGVLLAASGDANKAGKYLDLAAAGQLLPEEKALLQTARSTP